MPYTLRNVFRAPTSCPECLLPCRPLRLPPCPAYPVLRNLRDCLLARKPPCLQNAARYQNLVAGAEDVESCLGSCFAEHLNAEIVLQTIRSVEQAVDWLRTTFLCIRVSGRGGADHPLGGAGSGVAEDHVPVHQGEWEGGRRPSARWSRLWSG